MNRSDRLLPEPPSLGGRTPFQRDRDRILYSAHFRRLAGVTQVTTPSELYTFHNRLTHTLEVAQIARRMAERAIRTLPTAQEYLDPDVCEAAALGHDLGHPPFGHNGEKALDTISKGKDPRFVPRTPIRDGYEGNAQALRIVLKLSPRLPEQRGLNLTAATLRALVKYPWTYDDSRGPKFSVFDSEQLEFAQLWDNLPAETPVLEAQIMDWADDIAYSTHDFYDFALAGIIPVSDLKLADAVALKEMLGETSLLADVSVEAFDHVAQRLTLLPDPPTFGTSRFTSMGVAMMKEWVSLMIGRCASEQTTFESASGGVAMRRSREVADEVAILKAISFRFAIGSPALAVRREGERRILRTLFEIIEEGAISHTSGGRALLSDDALERLDNGDPPGRVILDVISSLSDAQAVTIYHKLTGIAPISILDLTTPSAF